ncbi:hypothetical protein PC9H_007169 [Pleurotus ostreatus]|uniref:Uncharacterized protein n=1 Tax=Pleurotus ostreatus TaxID=5322 RepID=A0A8H7DR98_PLEOS|nr:uncharacterized protein PC9H_007169 [Pleurotus ostreatus]KAF7427952.1 hypothetical protein PC9H_007169 [Pleurotus ostreatus]
MEGEYLLAPNCVAKRSHFTTASPDPRILSKLRSIPFNKIPEDLGPSRPDGLPELFWCCWVVGEHKIFNFFGNPHPGKPDVFDTSSCAELTVSELPAVLETALLLPPELAEKMAVVKVFNWEGKPELAFAVGSNYGGIMPVAIIELISRYFFDGGHPSWALNAPRADSATILPLTEEQRNDMQVVGAERKLSWPTGLDRRAFDELMKVS